MKILHLLYESKGDYFGIGGVGIRAYEIYKRLNSRHDITLLCKKYPGAQDGEIEELRHIFVGSESKSLTKTLLSYAYRAAQFIKRHGNEFDIIIEEFSPALPTFSHLFTEKPIVLQVQGYTGKFYFQKYNPIYATVLYYMERLMPKFYNYFIFISSEMLKRFSLRSTQYFEIVPNGVSSGLFDISINEGNYILYIGRIDIYSKGLDLLVNAYKEFCKSFPDIRLVVAGDGRDTGRFKRLLNTLPEAVMNNIEILGWVSGKVKEDVLKSALFVVFPSRHEVQPITSLEAMACGKAIIVSDIPEFRFVTENRAGISFKNGSAEFLAHSMKDLVENNERREMGKRGRDCVRDYTWEKVVVRYEEVLEKVITRTESKS